MCVRMLHMAFYLTIIFNSSNWNNGTQGNKCRFTKGAAARSDVGYRTEEFGVWERAVLFPY